MFYKKLEVYKRAYAVVAEIHPMTNEFPRHERYEIGSQLRRAAVSIVLNIAEGYGRLSSNKEKINFLRISFGSVNESEVLLELCKDFSYIDEAKFQKIAEELRIISAQLISLIESLKKQIT